jgi:ABC-2 type transport system permease protein
MSTDVLSAATDGAAASAAAPRGLRTPVRTPGRVPLTRLVRVELRKSFDTRSGQWLLASLGLAAFLTTGAIIAWAPPSELAYSQFTLAIGVPMTIILPIIAVLSVTSEWSQRSGLATFTLVPHRGRVVTAKAVAAVLVTVPATAIAFGAGAVGNTIGAALAGVPPVWDRSLVDVGYFAAGQTLLLLVGFVLGALIRNSAGAVVAYMLYAFVVPGLLAFLAFNQDWFADTRPWVDAKYSQDALLRGQLAGDGWYHLAVTSLVWLVVPMVLAVVNVLRSEVK